MARTITSYELMPTDGPRDARQTSRVINQAMSGKQNVTGDFTVTDTDTFPVTIIDQRCSAQSLIFLFPTTLDAIQQPISAYNPTKGSFQVAPSSSFYAGLGTLIGFESTFSIPPASSFPFTVDQTVDTAAQFIASHNTVIIQPADAESALPMGLHLVSVADGSFVVDVSPTTYQFGQGRCAADDNSTATTLAYQEMTVDGFFALENITTNGNRFVLTEGGNFAFGFAGNLATAANGEAVALGVALGTDLQNPVRVATVTNSNQNNTGSWGLTGISGAAFAPGDEIVPVISSTSALVDYDFTFDLWTVDPTRVNPYSDFNQQSEWRYVVIGDTAEYLPWTAGYRYLIIG